VIEAVVSNADIQQPIGAPVPPFDAYMPEAKDWCAWACLNERKCYLAAIWQSLPIAEQEAFLNYLDRRAAA